MVDLHGQHAAVNGNPLLRYDGYYILADLVESPNLWQRSREALQHFVSRWILGNRSTKTRSCRRGIGGGSRPMRVASKIYSHPVRSDRVGAGAACSIRTISKRRLPARADALLRRCVSPVAYVPDRSAIRSVAANSASGRLATVATLALVAAIVILAWPVNYYVRAPLVLLPTNATRVYATVDGTLRRASGRRPSHRARTSRHARQSEVRSSSRISRANTSSLGCGSQIWKNSAAG